MLEICKSVENSLNCEGLKTEFVADVVSCVQDTSVVSQNESELIYNTIYEIQNRIDELNSEIDKLTNHADGIVHIMPCRRLRSNAPCGAETETG